MRFSCGYACVYVCVTTRAAIAGILEMLWNGTNTGTVLKQCWSELNWKMPSVAATHTIKAHIPKKKLFQIPIRTGFFFFCRKNMGKSFKSHKHVSWDAQCPCLNELRFLNSAQVLLSSFPYNEVVISRFLYGKQSLWNDFISVAQFETNLVVDDRSGIN